jgi:hypothetical protein
MTGSSIPRDPQGLAAKPAIDPAAAVREIATFGARIAAQSPRVSRVALLTWPHPGEDFPVIVELKDGFQGPEDNRAMRREVQAAAIPAIEVGCNLLLHVVPGDAHEQLGQGIALWPLGRQQASG